MKSQRVQSTSKWHRARVGQSYFVESRLQVGEGWMVRTMVPSKFGEVLVCWRRLGSVYNKSTKERGQSNEGSPGGISSSGHSAMSSNTSWASCRVIPVCPGHFRNSLLMAVSVGQPTFQGHCALAAPIFSQRPQCSRTKSGVWDNTKLAQCLTCAQTRFG